MGDWCKEKVDVVLLYSIGCIHPIPACQTLITLILLIIESFLSSEQITLTLSVQRPYLLTYSYDVVLLYSLGCIHPISTCQTMITLITLIIESFLSYEQITLTLSVHRPYLLTYSYDVVLLYSIGCIHPIPACQTLITLILLIIESFLSSEQITLTLSVQRPYLLTYSYDVVLLYSLGCIHPISTCQTLITLITLIIESFLSSEQITLTLSVQRPYLLTYSYDVVLLYSLGCIHPIPTCQTLITPITLVTESFQPYAQIPSNYPLTALARAVIWLKTLSVQQCYLWIYSYVIVLL